jgi:hypothetical protein
MRELQPNQGMVPRRIFLAGSIEMGAADDWQRELIGDLSKFPVDVFNPRRSDWNSDWGPDSDEVKNQIAWELDAMEQADLIAMYFDPHTKSPITLLELGLWARSGKLFVCIPTGYWRRTNVIETCRKYNVKYVESYAAFRMRVMNFARYIMPVEAV